MPTGDMLTGDMLTVHEVDRLGRNGRALSAAEPDKFVRKNVSTALRLFLLRC
ncbi:hypothetical protein [Amycolatopsis sp. lyj-108]|uniref:hypothetical protein n=1 Tax=Amycolatopsis sp. lyj-108 TaxID=2789286 RepID=UPI00397836F4